MLNVQGDDIDAVAREYVAGPYRLDRLGEQTSGEDVLRESFMDAMDRIQSGEYDAVVLYDLSKAARNGQFMWLFINACVDHGVRFISIGDNIDTADEHWEIAANAAMFMHGTHIPQTRRRVKSQASHAFKNGGNVTKVPYGYRKLSAEESASGQFGPKGLAPAQTRGSCHGAHPFGCTRRALSTHQRVDCERCPRANPRQ